MKLTYSMRMLPKATIFHRLVFISMVDHLQNIRSSLGKAAQHEGKSVMSKWDTNYGRTSGRLFDVS